MKPVCVIWEDAVHYPINEDADVPELCACGFLYKKTKKSITLLTLNRSDHSPAFIIPRGCVKKIIKLDWKPYDNI